MVYLPHFWDAYLDGFADDDECHLDFAVGASSKGV